jgi:curved DNA-binding protein CbpA
MEDIAQLYRTLELEPGATSEEIKAAYLDMVKVWHPDRYQHESGFSDPVLFTDMV